MGLRETLNDDLKVAMKAGLKRKLATIRLMNAAIKDKDILGRTAGHASAVTPDAGLLELFAKMVKQRQDSIAAFEQGGRAELAAAEREEIEIIQSYMPKQLAEDAVKAAVIAAISATGAQGMKDMGKVVAALKAQYSGQMDFAKASGVVKALLG
jgi:uncharacterized protein